MEKTIKYICPCGWWWNTHQRKWYYPNCAQVRLLKILEKRERLEAYELLCPSCFNQKMNLCEE